MQVFVLICVSAFTGDWSSAPEKRSLLPKPLFCVLIENRAESGGGDKMDIISGDTCSSDLMTKPGGGGGGRQRRAKGSR